VRSGIDDAKAAALPGTGLRIARLCGRPSIALDQSGRTATAEASWRASNQLGGVGTPSREALKCRNARDGVDVDGCDHPDALTESPRRGEYVTLSPGDVAESLDTSSLWVREQPGPARESARAASSGCRSRLSR